MLNKNCRLKKKAVLLAIALFCSMVADSHAKIAPVPARVGMYIMGVGAQYFLNWLIASLYEEIEFKKALAQNIPREFLKGEYERSLRSNLMEALSTSLLVSFREYLGAFLSEGGIPSASTQAFLDSFRAGSRIPYLEKAIRGGLHFGKGVGNTLLQLAQEAGYASLDSAKIAWDAFLTAARGIPHTYTDLQYPLTPSRATNLYCGPHDPYCLLQETHPSNEDLFWSNPDLTVLTLARLLGAGTVVAWGVAAAIISYQVGNIVSTFIVGHIGSPLLEGALRNIVQETLEYYGLLEALGVFKRQMIALIKAGAVKYDEKGHVSIDRASLESLFFNGVRGRYVYKGTYPRQKQFIKGVGEEFLDALKNAKYTK